MNPQERALIDIAQFLADAQVQYMVVGGMANAAWGMPRSTVDVDVTVWVEESRIEQFIRDISDHLDIIPNKPLEFVRDTHVLPVKGKEDVKIDLIFGMSAFEFEAIGRAVTRKVAGTEVRFCTAEDLILHKIISEREQDVLDIKRLIEVRRDELDREYLAPRVKEFADIMERPEILDIYRKAFGQGE